MFSQLATHSTLLAKVATGDAGAWREFSDRYSELIRAFCRRQGLQVADIDDVQQDVLLSLSKAMPRFQYDPAKGAFRSYLKTVVLHAIYRRSCQKRPSGSLEDWQEQSRIAGADADIDQQWEAEWRQHHLRQALRAAAGEFNEADMSAFEQYAVRGREAREVAEALGLSVDQVYQAKSRIMKRIMALIEQQTTDEG